MILIITHSKDNDGHFSGAICQYFEEKINGIKSEDIIYLRWSYGDKDPERSELEKYSKIYILDLTLPDHIMEYFAREYKGSVVWIDHHLANYSRLPEYINNLIPGTRDHNYSASINTWNWWINFMTPEQFNTIKEFNERVYNAFPALELDESFYKKADPDWERNRGLYPYWLYLSGCYDIWRWNGTELWDKYIIPFEYCLKATIDGPKGAYEMIKMYFNCIESCTIPDVSSYINTGRVVYKYQEKRNKSILGNVYKMTVLNEMTGTNVNCLVINTIDRGSKIFDTINPELKIWADYYILWNCYGRKYKYSAYSEKENMLVPNLKIKGCQFGGHPHAGGVVTDKKRLL